jgi:glycosyltransferase involved in cell wall biosynthesis
MVKIGEYLAAGRPLVAYRLRESVRTARDAGLFAECGNRAQFVQNVARLSLDATLRAEHERRGLARAAQLDWGHSERALLTAYAQL